MMCVCVRVCVYVCVCIRSSCGVWCVVALSVCSNHRANAFVHREECVFCLFARVCAQQQHMCVCSQTTTQDLIADMCKNRTLGCSKIRFKPVMVLKVLPALMNTMVVAIMSGTYKLCVCVCVCVRYHGLCMCFCIEPVSQNCAM